MEKKAGELQGIKVLFATVPADGHFNPLTGLAKHLQQAGCDVRWYTSDIFEQKLKNMGIPHYTFEKALNLTALNLDEHIPERKYITDPLKNANSLSIHIFAKRSSEYYEDILTIQQSFPFEIMISDAMFPAIPLVKQKMNIPVMAIGVIPLAERSADLAPYAMGLPPAQNDKDRIRYAALHDQFINIYLKESIDYFYETLKQHGIDVQKSSVPDMLIKQSSLYLQIGTPGFEYRRRDLGSNIRFIGELLPYSSAKQEKQWSDPRLKAYQKIVFVTQGTVERDTKKIIEPTLQAFQDTDVLVIATTGGFGTAELKKKYASENFIISDYIPYTDVMPHAHAFITNGGYGGTLLGLHHKLPIVAGGIHEGKSEICARIGYFKLGINLKTETPAAEDIKQAVEEVISNPVYRANISSLREEMSNYDPLALCSRYLLELLTPRSSCFF